MYVVIKSNNHPLDGCANRSIIHRLQYVCDVNDAKQMDHIIIKDDSYS